MADGALMVTLDEDIGRRLRAAADAAGRSVDEYAAALISSGLNDWGEDFARLAEYEATGRSVPAADALQRFHALLEERLAGRE